MPDIAANNLQRAYQRYASEYEQKALDVLRSGWYILGGELREFEHEWADYLGVKHCVGVGNGLDAITIALHCLGIGAGDEVIVQGNTYIASVMGITINGATPVFVEPDLYFGINVGEIEEKITERTKAVMAVHLYGIPCQMDRLTKLCAVHGITLIEDCAQSHGATFAGKMTGTFGTVGCFSFYPTKNLGAFGDGGCIVTDSDELAESLRIYRNYGSEKHNYNKVVGTNSRLDELQAGLLRVKLSHLDELNAERQALAERYECGITNPKIKKPLRRPDTSCVWHQYVVRCEQRDELIHYLDARGIDTIIHYPIPPHLSEAYHYLGHTVGTLPITERYANEVLSIPMFNGLAEEEQQYVIAALNDF